MIEISPGRRRWILWAFRLLILAAVVIGVRGTFQGAIDRLADHTWRIQPRWLVASGMFYIAGLGAMAWFWRHALAALDRPVPWLPALCAYYLGHLGKYVPGKALVIVIRVAGVRRFIDSTWLGVFSTLLETLLMMAVGACLAAALVTGVLPLRPGMTWLAVATAAVCVLPTLPPIAHRLAHIGLRRFPSATRDSSVTVASESLVHKTVDRFTWPLWASGCFAACVCWCLLALSLWATLRGIGVDRIDAITSAPFLVGAVSLAVVVGFLSFLPGGILVRDALLMQALAPVCGDSNALVAAVLLRLVWLVSELVTCGILYGAAFRNRPT